MKNLIVLVAFIMSTVAFSQNIEPKLEIVDSKVKATYYHNNGNIQQEGFFKDGKLDGKWTSYDTNGNVEVIANYSNGKKSGKWIFDSKEVVYNNNQVISVTSLSQNPIAKN